MPTPYVASVDGEWDASITDTWGQGIGVYPNTAGDVWTIGAGKTVTYNKVSTVEMGAGSITGLLTFSTAMNTKLTMSHNDITVNNGGELRVGASGAEIPAAYLAELIWNTTADNAKGINIASGGKLTVYGDPDYFGSDKDTVLTAQAIIPAATNPITITVAGDFTTKWAIGQELIVHKGGTYASYINDFCRLAITGLVLNGANTDIATTVTERPAALTCLVGADVLNVSRNVLLYKLSYNANLGQNNTLRPRIANANVIGTSNINVHDAMFGGWNTPLTGYGIVFDGVIRNGANGASTASLATIGGIILAVFYPVAYTIHSTINSIIVGSTYGLLENTGCTFIGNVFGNVNAWNRGTNNIYSGNYYSNGTCDCINNASIVTGKIGYNTADLAMANATDLSFNQGGGYGYGLTKLLNVKIQSTPTFSSRNSVIYRGRFCFEHYQQVANAHYIADAFGDITKTAADGTGDNPTQRSGGNADVIEAVPQSNCAAVSYLELLNIRLWAAAGVSKTYRFYVQTDFATLPTAELKLYGEYLDEGSGGHLASATPSTQDITTRADADDWSQYVEVTINPAQTGYVNLYMRLMGYEAAKKVWVDPMGVIT